MTPRHRRSTASSWSSPSRLPPPTVGRAEVVANIDATSGCSSSLHAGLDRAGDCEAVLLLLGDMPGVGPELIDDVVRALAGGAVVGRGDALCRRHRAPLGVLGGRVRVAARAARRQGDLEDRGSGVAGTSRAIRGGTRASAATSTPGPTISRCAQISVSTPRVRRPRDGGSVPFTVDKRGESACSRPRSTTSRPVRWKRRSRRRPRVATTPASSPAVRASSR